MGGGLAKGTVSLVFPILPLEDSSEEGPFRGFQKGLDLFAVFCKWGKFYDILQECRDEEVSVYFWSGRFPGLLDALVAVLREG